MTCQLSVNVNKVALVRNTRHLGIPSVTRAAELCLAAGAHGITVHPRPDERHVRAHDVHDLAALLKAWPGREYNIEGNPTEQFLKLVLDNAPAQCTLVPDPPGALTSSQGWNTLAHKDFLTDVVARLQEKGIRVSVFIDAEEAHLEGAKAVGADRVEFYTGNYALEFAGNPEKAVAAHARCALLAGEIGIGVNAGHDLNLDNLRFYREHVAGLLEVSIGHALICDALYFGLQNTIQMYLRLLQ